MKKILAILTCLPGLGYAMDAPLTPQEKSYSQDATQQLLQELDEMFPFTFGQEEKIKRLINSGANPNITDKNGNTVLILALKFEYQENFIEFLLERGANPDIKNNAGDTALKFSTSASSTRKLLEFNANPNSRNNAGETVLFDAVNNNWSQKISILLECDTDPSDPNVVDRDEDSPLINAVVSNNPAMVRRLLQAGANPKAQNKYHMTAIDYATIGLEQANTDAERAIQQEIVNMLTNPQNIRRTGLNKLT